MTVPRRFLVVEYAEYGCSAIGYFGLKTLLDKDLAACIDRDIECVLDNAVLVHARARDYAPVSCLVSQVLMSAAFGQACA